jgi:hypothetical protein
VIKKLKEEMLNLGFVWFLELLYINNLKMQRDLKQEEYPFQYHIKNQP